MLVDTRNRPRARTGAGHGLVVAAAVIAGFGGALAMPARAAPPVDHADTGDLQPTADATIDETLGTGVAGIDATPTHRDLGVVGAGQVIAVFDAGFDLAAVDADSPGAVGTLGNLSRDQPYSNTQSGECAEHGTEVAKRAAATAPAATIVPVVIRGRSACNMHISEDAVRWALGLPVAGLESNPTPATVLAWSFGALTPDAVPDQVCPLVTKAISWGAVVVASSGNDATDRANDFFPGACAGVLMVGNTDSSGAREMDANGYGSNIGTRVDLMAPAPSTSFAVPFVAGVVALARSADPSMTVAETTAVVRGNTRPFPQPCAGCGTGIVDAYLAVSAVRAGRIDAMQPVQLPAPSTPPLGFRPLVPSRLVDTRAAGGGGRLEPGAVRPVQVRGAGGVPGSSDATLVVGAPPSAADVRAAILNVTATGAAGAGYLTAYACGGPMPATSTVNVADGGTAAAAVTVQLDASGRVCVYSSTGTDLVVDVAGYFTTDPAAFTYLADEATPRVLDTRSSTPATPGASPLVVSLTGVSEGDAVTLNVTAVGRGGAGWLALTPCGATLPSAVSNVNVGAGGTVPNQATVRVGAGGTICISAGEAPIDVLVDVQGRWRAGAGARFVPITPTRVVDTRSAIGVDGDALIGPGTPIAYPVAQDGIVALAATVTATDSVRGGYLQVSPCDAARMASNTSSALNLAAGDGARANGVFAPIDPATKATCVTAGPAPGTPLAHVLVDVTGWFTTE